MAVAGPNEVLISFLMLFSGFLGIPVGMPPEPEDALMARIAPDQCLYYTTWSGMAEPDPNSTNQTEQLLAEPEIQQLVDTVSQKLVGALRRQAGNGGDSPTAFFAAEGPRLLKTLLTRPTAIYLSEIEIGPTGPQIEAGMIIGVGDDVEQIKAVFERLQTQALGDQVREVDIDDVTFYSFQPAPTAPSITWGTRGKYLIIGLGDGTVEAMFERARTAPPEWLTALRERLPVDRVSTVTYVNVGKLVDTFLPMAPAPQVAQVVDALGLGNLTEYGSVSGLDETGVVRRSFIGIDGEAKGLLSCVDAPPLTADDLAPVPQDALAALAFRLDMGNLVDTILDVVGQVEPRAVEEMEEEVADVEQEIGFKVREDLLRSLGDVWTISTSSSEGGLLTGWMATVSLRDPQRFREIHDEFARRARRAMEEGHRAPQIRELRFAEQTIYYLVVPDDDFPLTPAWCVTDDVLAVSLFPQTLKGYVSRGAEYVSLAEAAAVKPLLEGDSGPLAISYCDTRQLFRTVYPLAQIGVQFALHFARKEGFDLDPILLPSAGSIERHLLPTVGAIKRTDSGIETFSHQTLPGGNIGATAPVAVALLLPAVQAARGAARRSQGTNNLKQIALAMHNYHDTFRGLPAAHSNDAAGNPLLSWRVHVLPFIEEQALYEQFRLDEPWDSEHNKKLIPLMPRVYRAPGSDVEPGKTNYLGIRGENMIFIAPKKQGEGGKWPIGTGFRDVLDGTSNTIMVVEASDEEAVIWTKPGDYEPDEENPTRGLVGVRPGGFLAAFCDGSVHFISESVDFETLRRLFTRNDGNPVSEF